MATFREKIEALCQELSARGVQLRLKFGSKKYRDKRWRPTLWVMGADCADKEEGGFRYRPRGFLINASGYEHERELLVDPDAHEDEDEESQLVYLLAINGYGEPFLDAETGEAVVLPCPVALIRYDDQRTMTQKEVAKMASVNRTKVYKAAKDGHLTPHMMEGKHARYVQEQVKAWIRGETRPRKKT